MITQDTLLTVWKGCLNYEPKQEELLYKILAPKMMAVCMRYAHSREEAQDILQDGFIKTFKNRHTYRNQGSLEGWVRRIMVYTALSSHRKNRPTANTCQINDDITYQTYNNDSLEAAELLTLISGLPDTYRNVFNMYAIEGYSHQEIGSTLGMSELLSRTTLCRARTVLKNRLSSLDTKPMYKAIA